MSKKNKLYALGQTVISILSAFGVLIWILDRWFSTQVGLIGFLLFLIGAYYLFQKKKYFKKRKSISKSCFFLSIASFLLVFVLEYNILKSISFFAGLLFSWLTYFKLSSKKTYLVAIWLLFSLPIIPLLGSSIGILNRTFYTYGLSFLMNTEKVVGTSLYDGVYKFSIDSGCSGVLSFYLLVCFWIVYSFKKEKVVLRPLFLSIFFLWLLNTFRVFVLYITHNKLHYENLDNLDLFLGILFFAITLALMYKKLEKFKTNS